MVRKTRGVTVWCEPEALEATQKEMLTEFGNVRVAEFNFNGVTMFRLRSKRARLKQ